MPKFIVQHRSTQEEQAYHLNQGRILIGRTEDCEVELPSRSVSRSHAEITSEDEDYFLTDLNSGNGTGLNGKKVRAGEKHLLRSGDLIRIEEYDIRFFLDDESTTSDLEEDTDTDILEIKLLKKMMRALDSEDTPSLEVLAGSSSGQRIFLKEQDHPFIIGRDEACDLSLAENVLSRRHVQLEHKWGGVVITDLSSKNGTFVNNEPVQEKLLHDGDRILLGTLKILYRNPKEVNAQLTHQELQKKKLVAALEEAEAINKKQAERTAQEEAEADLAQAEAEAQAQEVEESLADTNTPEPATAEASEKNTEASAPSTPPAPAGKPKLSTTEWIFIGLGAVVGLAALSAVVLLFL